MTLKPYNEDPTAAIRRPMERQKMHASTVEHPLKKVSLTFSKSSLAENDYGALRLIVVISKTTRCETADKHHFTTIRLNDHTNK